MTTASAPGKIILFGEHAVVYGQPALAAPVTQVFATAEVSRQPSAVSGQPAEIWIDARDLGKRYRLDDAPENDPLAAAVRLTLASGQRSAVSPQRSPPTSHLSPLTDHCLLITISSSIPRASGLGSGAAVCTAIVRALAAHYHLPLTTHQIASLVFETEKLLHGTPSGIDNTVIAYEQPVYFIKGQPPAPFTVAVPFHLLIADTGIASPTKIAVGDVRAGWQKEPERYEALFSAIGAIVNEARTHIEGGEPHRLGPLMNRNHALLCEMGVSCAELDALTAAARDAGALGAKLSGGGRGGNLIALVTPETEAQVRAALERAGAQRVIKTMISGSVGQSSVTDPLTH